MANYNPNEYALGCHLKPAPKHHEMKLIRSIASADLDKVWKAMHQLGDFATCCGLYEICEANYQSILSHYSTLKEGIESNRHRAHEYMEEAFQEMNRLLLNYLASFRTLLDHLATRYTRLDRQGSSYLDDFKRITAACYDSSFSYRFFYQLRNYVQHCGLPLAEMKTTEYPDHDGSVLIDISICFDRDNLISAYKNWGKVKVDLQSKPAYMELIPYLNEFNSQIQLINIVVTGIELSLADDSWQTLYELVSEVQSQYPNGRPFIGRYVKSERGKRGIQVIDLIDFPLHTMVKYQKKLNEVQDFKDEHMRARNSAT